MFATATARTRATLEMQTEEERAAIREYMAHRVEHNHRGVWYHGRACSTAGDVAPAVAGTDATLFDGRPSGRRPFQLPMPCVVASAAKPSA